MLHVRRGETKMNLSEYETQVLENLLRYRDSPPQFWLPLQGSVEKDAFGWSRRTGRRRLFLFCGLVLDVARARRILPRGA